MTSLLYRDDFDEARDRMTKFWNGGDIGRAAVHLTAPRAAPVEDIPAMPTPPNWVTWYSTRDMAYRLNCNRRAFLSSYFMGESIPCVSADVGPNSLALFLGCKGHEAPGTVWFEPFIDDPDKDDFGYDPDNFYWKFVLQLTRQSVEHMKGKCLGTFPDLIEGLDTIAAMRGTDRLLLDLLDRPEWVQRCLRKITDLYFRYYDVLYDMIRDDRGGSSFWAWAPGRMVKLQCDFSAMISKEMFVEFMVPLLTEMTDRIGYSMYHWDGPGALQHHDAILSIPNLKMLQWTPGSGQPGTWHKKWWPMYHKTIEAGKKLIIGLGNDQIDEFKREFGEKTKSFIVGMNAKSIEEGREILKRLEV